MNILLLTVFSIVCLWLLWTGLRAAGGIYEFPFLAGATFFGFVLPHAIGLLNAADLPQHAIEKTFLMAVLCSAMCYVGYSLRKQWQFAATWDIDETRLLWAGIFLTGVGAYFFFALSRLPEDLLVERQWSGMPVRYLFFARLLSYGFAITLLLYARNGSKIALATALFGSLFYIDRIFIAGRRGTAVEFGAIVALSLWFGRRLAIPRALVLAAIFASTLVLHSIGDYRAVTMQDSGPKWVELRRVPFLDNLKLLLTQGGHELRNAAHIIEGTANTGQFDYGLFHWNTLVFNYVPAQVFGPDFKESLLFQLPDVAYEEFGYKPHIGTTNTGLADAYSSFWYFGCVKFLVIALCMARLYHSAMAGNTTSQLFYMMILAPALHAITHHTQWFVSSWLHIVAFLWPALYFARSAKTQSADDVAAIHAIPKQVQTTSSL